MFDDEGNIKIDDKVILAASLSATYLDIASDCEQQSRTELKTIYLSFVWSLLSEPHPSKPVEDTSKNAKVKITQGGSNVCLFSHVPHAQGITCI